LGGGIRDDIPKKKLKIYIYIKKEKGHVQGVVAFKGVIGTFVFLDKFKEGRSPASCLIYR